MDSNGSTLYWVLVGIGFAIVAATFIMVIYLMATRNHEKDIDSPLLMFATVSTTDVVSTDNVPEHSLMDGHVVLKGDIILVKDQGPTDPYANGLYEHVGDDKIRRMKLPFPDDRHLIVAVLNGEEGGGMYYVIHGEYDIERTVPKTRIASSNGRLMTLEVAGTMDENSMFRLPVAGGETPMPSDLPTRFLLQCPLSNHHVIGKTPVLVSSVMFYGSRIGKSRLRKVHVSLKEDFPYTLDVRRSDTGESILMSNQDHVGYIGTDVTLEVFMSVETIPVEVQSVQLEIQ